MYLDKITAERYNLVNEQMFIIQNLINECDYLQITPIEYGYLKLITTLESGKSCVFFFIT